MTLRQLAARSRATASHLVGFVFIGVGLFLFGYVIGYYTGSDTVALATVECSSGWRQTIENFSDCSKTLDMVVTKCNELAVSCEKIQSQCRSMQCTALTRIQ